MDAPFDPTRSRIQQMARPRRPAREAAGVAPLGLDIRARIAAVDADA